MIDLSNLKSPGWAHVVSELSAPAPDDKAYLERMLGVLAHVSAARQAALFVPVRGGEGEEVEVRAVSVWPGSPSAAAGGEAQGTPQVEHGAEAASAARAALSSGQPRAFSLDKGDQYYGTAGEGYVLAVPVPAGGAPQQPHAGAVITLLVDARSREAVRSTLAMAEVLAGYVHGHAARQMLRRTQAASFALDLATRLIASINNATNFKGVVIQLVNDLAKQFGVDRVALGWVKGDAVRVAAISDTEHFDRRMAMVQRLGAAMEECLDQEQPVLYPPPPAEQDVLLAQAIVHAHRELASGDAKLKVCSLPLRIDEEVVGVVTIESTGEGQIDLATIELIQSALDLVAPVLRIRRSDDRALPLRAWDSGVRAAAWAVGPRHTVWKLVALLVLAAAVFVTFYQTTYRVGAEAVLEPRERRIVSAPIEGIIKRLGEGVEPGRVVEAGDLLLELDATEWELSAADARGKIVQAETQAAAARREGKTADAQQAEAQAERARAELRIYEHRVERSRVLAPIAGTIIGGELKERVGAAVKLGDALLEIAPLDEMIVVARVDERDIKLVKEAHERALAGGPEGALGSIATKSYPGESFSMVVERIVPLAASEEGTNTFEVRARLLETAGWMRPGMEARAKFDTEEASLLWIGSRRIVDTVRLWLW